MLAWCTNICNAIPVERFTAATGCLAATCDLHERCYARKMLVLYADAVLQASV